MSIAESFDPETNANCTHSHWRQKPDVSGCWGFWASVEKASVSSAAKRSLTFHELGPSLWAVLYRFEVYVCKHLVCNIWSVPLSLKIYRNNSESLENGKSHLILLLPYWFIAWDLALTLAPLYIVCAPTFRANNFHTHTHPFPLRGALDLVMEHHKWKKAKGEQPKACKRSRKWMKVTKALEPQASPKATVIHPLENQKCLYRILRKSFNSWNTSPSPEPRIDLTASKYWNWT